MTADEFKAWISFHEHFPIDDHNRLYRPAAAIASSFGGNYEAVLTALSPDSRKQSAPLRMASVVKPKE